MKIPTRYRLKMIDYGPLGECIGMAPDSEGEYVTYAAFRELEKELTEAHMELRCTCTDDRPIGGFHDY